VSSSLTIQVIYPPWVSALSEVDPLRGWAASTNDGRRVRRKNTPEGSLSPSIRSPSSSPFMNASHVYSQTSVHVNVEGLKRERREVNMHQACTGEGFIWGNLLK